MSIKYYSLILLAVMSLQILKVDCVQLEKIGKDTQYDVEPMFLETVENAKSQETEEAQANAPIKVTGSGLQQSLLEVNVAA